MRTIQSEMERHGIKNRHKKKKPEKKKHETLTERDIKELMGINRPTYKRHKGAFRQRS